MYSKRPILETDRLQIFPLTHNQLINYLQVDGSLEEELDVEPLKRKISYELIQAFEQVILPAVGNPSKNYLFATLWTIIDKEKKVMVGDLCFKGEPSVAGEVEIRFATYPQFQKRGYMTEAVGALCQWALDQGKAAYVIAETINGHLASQKVLEKNGFTVFSKASDSTLWRLQKAEGLAVVRA